MTDDYNSPIVIGISVFALIFLFGMLFIIAWGFSQTPPVPESTLTNTGGFLGACTTTTCNSGFECDGNTYTCKLPLGSQCTIFSDCANGLICSGLCATGAVGGLDQLCPCDTGFTCAAQVKGPNICKSTTNCTMDSDCYTLSCNSDGFCEGSFPLAHACTSNLDCGVNDSCSLGFCQPVGFITGSQGAACAGDCVAFVGATCNNTVELPLVCNCTNGANSAGICSITNRGILSICTPSNLCADPLTCLNITAQICNSATGCSCIFPYDDPNNANSFNQCINGMAPIGNLCFNQFSVGCNSGDSCLSGDCNGPSVVNFYHFSSVTGGMVIDQGINFAAATNTDISLSFAGPTGRISPYTMLAFTAGGAIDDILLIDQLQGILTIRYTVTNWVQLVPAVITSTVGGVTNMKTLIDAAYNPSVDILIIAFHETITMGTNIQQNDTVYTLTNGALVPYNVQTGSGIPGTQYTTANLPLTINYIDISNLGDVLLSSSGSIYTKTATGAKYTLAIQVGGPFDGSMLVGTTGPAQFYANLGVSGNVSINNIAYIKNYVTIAPPISLTNVLQFSGSFNSTVMPTDPFAQLQYEVYDFDIFSPPVPGANNYSISMLAAAYNGTTFVDNMVALANAGTNTVFPLRVTTANRTACSANSYYVISNASCL